MAAAAQNLHNFTKANWYVSIDLLRRRLEPLLRDPDTLQKEHGSIRSPLPEERCISVLHSPTLRETAKLLIAKYQVFFDITLRNPNNMAVPTLDVDLASHTYQVQPRWYYNYSSRLLSEDGIRQFIDHDGKVDENALSDAFEWTNISSDPEKNPHISAHNAVRATR
ncbi:hypothetical protein BJX96DRAFT_180852 [Aspergillus floccosus]